MSVSPDDKTVTVSPPHGATADTISVERYCPSCDDSFAEDVARCPKDGTTLVPLPMTKTDLIGKVIANRFTVNEAIGAGGMGAVYRATQHSVGREVAIKFVNFSLSQDTVAAKRFLREAKLCSRLSHANSVTVLDFGVCDTGQLFMVMELLSGQTLADAIKAEDTMAIPQVLHIVRQICAALEAAHALDIVHRDLKPANIMLAQQGDGSRIVKVLDFGLAKSLATDETAVTKSDAVLGTPHYISPEVIDGQIAGPAADLYSLGVIMYEMLAGTRPFKGRTAQSLMAQHVASTPPALPTDLPPGLRDLVMRLLKKNPDDRPESARAVRQALADAGTSPPNAASSKWRMVAPGVAVAIAGILGILGIVVFVRSNKSSPKHTAAAPMVIDASVAVPDAPARAAIVTRDAAVAVQPKPNTVEITFRTLPRRARVVRDGKTLCHTPCTRSFARKQLEAAFVLVKNGYRPHPLKLSLARDHSLKPARLRRSRRLPRTTPATTPATTPETTPETTPAVKPKKPPKDEDYVLPGDIKATK